MRAWGSGQSFLDGAPSLSLAHAGVKKAIGYFRITQVTTLSQNEGKCNLFSRKQLMQTEFSIAFNFSSMVKGFESFSSDCLLLAYLLFFAF